MASEKRSKTDQPLRNSRLTHSKCSVKSKNKDWWCDKAQRMYDVKQSIMMQTLLSDADKRTCRIISKRLNGIKNDYEKRLKCSKSSRIDFYNKTNKQKFWKLIKKNMRPKMIIPISIDEIKSYYL